MWKIWRVVAAAAAVAGSLACASGGAFLRPQQPPVGGEPWEAPPEAYPSQRLYRVKYEGPEGKLSFKLTLYLAGPEQYRMTAADGLGRKVWTLSLDTEGSGLWLNHRQKTYCQSSNSADLAVVPLARLPLVALPKLLLGRLPTIPASDLRRAGEHLSFLDARGQMWNGALRGGEIEWWSLVENGEPVAWWRREEEGGTFTHLGNQQLVRWREITWEPLAQPLRPLQVPSGFSSVDCSTSA